MGNITELYAEIGVDATQRIILEGITQEVDGYKQNLIEAQYYLGRALDNAKDVIGHGNFSLFVTQVLRLPKNTADNALKLYRNLGPEYHLFANNIDMSAAAFMYRKDFSDESRVKLIEKAKSGAKVTLKEVKRIYTTIITPEQEVQDTINKANAKMIKIQAKRVEPDINVQTLPSNVELLIDAAPDKLRSMYAEGFDMVALSITKYAAWLFNYEVIDSLVRTVKPDGDVIVITTPELMGHTLALFFPHIRYKWHIVSRLPALNRNNGSIDSSHLNVLWFSKNIEKEHQRIVDTITSDVIIEDGEIIVGVNEAAHMIDHLTTESSKILNINPEHGGVAEAACLTDRRIVIIDNNTETINNVIYRTSGYAQR